MAFAAVASLLQVLNQFSQKFSPISQIESFHTTLLSLQSLLEKNFSQPDLETQIRDAIHEAEDIIESRMSNYLLSEDATPAHLFLFTDWPKLQQLLDSAATLTNQLSQQSYYSTPNASSASIPTARGKLVGLEESLPQLKDQLIGESSRIRVVAVLGMAGIGKTTLVNEVYKDPSIKQFFHYRAWAKVGLNYRRRDVLIALLKSMDRGRIAKSSPETYEDAQLSEAMYKTLKGRRYLIVLDDVYGSRVWNELKSLFPDDNNGSRVMLTTRLRKVALHSAGTGRNVHQVRFLTTDQSWELLCDIVFKGGRCPYELLKIGKTIAQNCQGLPLTVVHVGDILSRGPKTLEYWEKVAKSQTSASTPDDDDVGLRSMVQYLNDESLPQHLKACFLYMGAFPINYEIPSSKLIKLWVSEGFFRLKQSKSLEEVAEECLEELVDRSLMLVHSRRSSGGIKTCSVHSAVWHLCVNAAVKHTFFRDVNRYTEGEKSQHSTSNRRRLCIRNNVLFGIKDMFNSIKSSAASTARSILCVGLYHSHPLHVSLNFKLLRVLDVLSILFHEFPNEILDLIQLRYLALTCNGREELPSGLAKLWNLHFLIVHRCLNIKSPGAPWHLPIEIWKMKQLRHLQVMGCDLPDPRGDDHLLPNLLSLTNVSAHSCNEKVLRRTPNLKRLGILIELPETVDEPFSLFEHIPLLEKLESFKCMVNPDQGPHIVNRPRSISSFPTTIKKLTLSGCRFPWEDMKLMAQLPNLLALKLRCYAFTGPKWHLQDEEFIKLNFLLLEDLDIQHWTAKGQILPKLKCLAIRHCYNLREIPLGVDYIPTLDKLELVDCRASVVDSAMRIKEMQDDLSNDDLQVLVKSSWKKKKHSEQLY